MKTTEKKPRKKKAKSGFGEFGLKSQARKLAADNGHWLNNFRKRPTGWEARCGACLKMVVINLARKRVDGTGIGGSATKEQCPGRRPYIYDPGRRPDNI